MDKFDNFENLNNFRSDDKDNVNVNENATQSTTPTTETNDFVSEQVKSPEVEQVNQILTPVYVSTNSYKNSTPEPEAGRKIKRGSFKAVIAAALAVVILGGGSGFGGAYFGNKYFEQDNSTAPPQIPEFYTSSDYISEDLALTSDTLVTNANKKEMTPEQLFEQVQETVVGIKLYYDTIARNRQVTTESSMAGSGVVFTTDGYVLTNYHVITDYKKIGVVVTTDDGIETEYEAEIVGMDDKTDLAILKITRKEAFKAAPIGDSSSLKIGRYVCAIGYPLDLGKSMTYGIVSGLNREVESGGYELSSIQIDAAVNMGNSGGPLFDMFGNVVGIVNKKLVYDNLVENMGFAITIDEAKPIINDLLAYGEVTSRPVLGITAQALNEYTASMLGVDVTEGLYIAKINSKAPVAKSGLAIGDIITKINGKEVYVVTDVQTHTKGLKAGDTIEATVIRYTETGKKQELTITIELTTEQATQ